MKINVSATREAIKGKYGSLAAFARIFSADPSDWRKNESARRLLHYGLHGRHQKAAGPMLDRLRAEGLLIVEKGIAANG